MYPLPGSRELRRKCRTCASCRRVEGVCTGEPGGRPDHFKCQSGLEPATNGGNAMKHLRTRTKAAVAIAAAGIAMSAGSVSAQPVTQEGLVNVNLTDVTVQIPIAVAANVCDVNVAVLVSELTDGSAPCDAS